MALLEVPVLVTSTSGSDLEVIAESLFNYRHGRLFGLSRRLDWGDDRDGVAVRAVLNKYCAEAPCLSLFVEKAEGGYFPELEGARVRLYMHQPVEAEVKGQTRWVYLGPAFAEGVMEKGKVDFTVTSDDDVFVEIIRRDINLQNSDERQLAMAG